MKIIIGAGIAFYLLVLGYIHSAASRQAFIETRPPGVKALCSSSVALLLCTAAYQVVDQGPMIAHA